jgi:hypothetical protein
VSEVVGEIEKMKTTRNVAKKGDYPVTSIQKLEALCTGTELGTRNL